MKRKYKVFISIILVTALSFVFSFCVSAVDIDNFNVSSIVNGSTSYNYTTFVSMDSVNGFTGVPITYYSVSSSVNQVQFNFSPRITKVNGDYFSSSFEFFVQNLDFCYVYIDGQLFNNWSATTVYSSGGDPIAYLKGNFTGQFSSSGTTTFTVVLKLRSSDMVLGVKSITFNSASDPVQIANNQANKINQGTQSAIDSAKNEQYGYSKKSSNNTDEGISAGGNLLDSLTASIDDFNDTVDVSVDNLLDNISGFKTMVHNIFDFLPDILQYLIIFGVVFLVVRKVVGR